MVFAINDVIQGLKEVSEWARLTRKRNVDLGGDDLLNSHKVIELFPEKNLDTDVQLSVDSQDSADSPEEISPRRDIHELRYGREKWTRGMESYVDACEVDEEPDKPRSIYTGNMFAGYLFIQ